MDMRERLARGLCLSVCDVDPDTSLGGDGQNFMWHEYIGTANIVMELMRDPTDKMIENISFARHANRFPNPRLKQFIREDVAAMIDAALKEDTND